MQSMAERNWSSTSVNSHVHPNLHLELHVRSKICLSAMQSLFVIEAYLKFHFKENRIKQSYDSKMWQTVGVVVAATKFLFSLCDCTVDSNVGTGDFSIMLEILNVCGHAYVSPGMD